MQVTFAFSWALLVQFALAIVLPLFVALVTTKLQSGALRAVLLAVLTLVTSLLTTFLSWLTGTPVEWFSVLLAAIGSFVISVSTYFGVWRATDVNGESVSSKLLAIGVKPGAHPGSNPATRF